MTEKKRRRTGVQPNICQDGAEPQESRLEKGVQEAVTSFEVGIPDILDALPFYTMLVDAQHHILLANSAVQTHLGVLPEDIIGKYCPKVIHGLDGPFPGCPLEEAVEKGQAVVHEVLDQKTGRWLRSAIYPTKGVTADGKQVYFHMVTDITDRKQAEEQLKISHERLRSLSGHLESVREEERNRIAHNLHDETSQVLSSLTAHLEAALGRLPTGANESRAMLEKARDLANKILDELHKLIYELHPFMLYDLGLVAAIGSLINTSLEPAGVKVHFQTKGRMKRFSPQLEITLFRVIQEAFNNIAKHAKAKNAEVSIHFQKGSMGVRIADDGKGFDVKEALSTKRGLRGFGLLSMKERVELVNGTLNIRSRPGGGTEINIEIPLL